MCGGAFENVVLSEFVNWVRVAFNDGGNVLLRFCIEEVAGDSVAFCDDCGTDDSGMI